MGLLDESRVAIPLIPERLIAEAARERGVDLARVERAYDDGTTMVGLDSSVGVVLADAFERMARLLALWVRIPFGMQRQQQSNWCWAATAVSVAHYYSWSSWTQCEMVNKELGQTTCCTNGSSSQCNQTHTLDTVLDRAWVLDHMVGGTVSYATVCAEIGAGRPLPIRIQWFGGAGHFIVIDGFRTGDREWVAVADPANGESDITLCSLLCGTYLGTGSWTHTYFTCRPLARRGLPDGIVLFPRTAWEQVRADSVELVKEGAR